MKYVNPYNTVEFYVGDITEPQTIKIYTDLKTSVDIEVSEGNKWYTYVLPKDKGLYKIYGNTVKKVVVKADISYKGGNHMYPPESIIYKTTIEASFKGSNTSNITSMYGMFAVCSNLTSLDVSSFDTSNVVDMSEMFYGCSNLTSLDVSHFNTSNVTQIEQMFHYCDNLQTLDLSGWDLTNLRVIGGLPPTYGLFTYCKSLNLIYMRGCNQNTIDKIKSALTEARIQDQVTIIT